VQITEILENADRKVRKDVVYIHPPNFTKYLEDNTSLRLALEDSKLEQAIRGADQGAGIRLFFGDLVTYAYTDDLSEASLLRAVEAARAAGNANQGLRMIDLTEQKSPLHYPIQKAFDTLSISDKAAILGRVDQVARGYDARVLGLGEVPNPFDSPLNRFDAGGLLGRSQGHPR
jgi:hypothetical protein